MNDKDNAFAIMEALSLVSPEIIEEEDEMGEIRKSVVMRGLINGGNKAKLIEKLVNILTSDYENFE